MDHEEGEPNDLMLDHLRAAEANLAALPTDERERVSDLLDGGFDAWAAAVGEFRRGLLLELGKAMDRLHGQLAYVPRHRVDWSAVRRAVAPIKDAARDTQSRLQTARSVARDDDLKEFIDGLLAFATQLATVSY